MLCRAVSGNASQSPEHYALNPLLIVCDEPVSSLDVFSQAQVINLFRDLQERIGDQLRLRRPRPVGRVSDQSPGRGDVRGHGRRDGSRRGHLPQPSAPLHEAVARAVLSVDPRVRRLGTRSREVRAATGGMCVRGSLRACDREVRDTAPGYRHDRGTRGRLLALRRLRAP